MLDTETDAKIYSNVQDTLVYMLQTLGPYNLTYWLQLCKDVLAITAGMIVNVPYYTSNSFLRYSFAYFKRYRIESFVH
jgi:hypothetical protein